MKRFLFVVICFLYSSLLFSQQPGNEWINYNQNYYKFNIYQDGIYRIPYYTLLAAGISTSIDPHTFQIFGRGVEQYIFVKGESDGTFYTSGYIEFYAQKNDGWLDSLLYHGQGNQGNPNYSLFTDTATYYLTWKFGTVRRLTIETDTSFTGYTQASYFNRVLREDYYDHYFNGVTYNLAADPEYIKGEGWFDSGFYIGSPIVKSLTTTNVFSGSGAPNAKIDFNIIGASDVSALDPDHHVNVQFAGTSFDTLYNGYEMFKVHHEITPLNPILNSGSLSFTFSSTDNIGSSSDINTLAYISVKYPHNFDLEGKSNYRMFVPNSTSASKTYMKITNFNSSVSDTAILYDLTNHKRIKTRWSPSFLEALVPNAAGEKECFVAANHQIASIIDLVPVSTDLSHFAKFTDYGGNANSNYIMITNKKLWTAANEYKNYRETNPQYVPLLLDVEELYDQFSYGIRKNPLAIRNFCRFAISHFNTVPKGLFLIGKSYKAGEDCNNNCSYRHNPTNFENSLVPGFGTPPSDILFTSKLLPGDTLYRPAIPTGRLAAREPSDVELYLNKVEQYENAMVNDHAEWMKNVLHFGGGTTLGQQQAFEGYLNVFKGIIEDTLFGGYVRTFLKNSPDPIQNDVSDSLKNIINNGVSLMTFFGHAAGIGFDMSIDNPAEYTNYGKYFFLLANSCLAGDLYEYGPTSSEAFVLIADKGAIGYLASTTPAVESSLFVYSTNFYNNISYLNYGQPVGKAIQQTIKSTELPSDLSNKNVCLNMTLHGDPAVIINSQPKPDYVVTPDKIYFNPTEVTSENDSFKVNVISTNIGRAVADSFFVKVVRTFPDNSTQTYLDKVKATLYKDTISFTMPVDKVKGLGLNHFWIMLDAPPSNIDELLENNNTVLDVPLFIKSYDIIPVYPYKYAIIPSNTVTLKASTGDPFATAKNYIFQLDTTDAFNSPLHMTYTVNHSGGVVPWSLVLPVLTQDSVVYYWRVSLDSSYYGGNANWRESSFQHIEGKRGWGQAHFFQFKNDAYEYVTYNKPLRRFDFVNNVLAISAQTGYTIQWNNEWYKINGANQYISAWMETHGGNGMIVAVLDSVSGVPWETTTEGHINQKAFEFETNTPIKRDSLRDFLAGIPNGDYVLAYSHRNHFAGEYDLSLLAQFNSIGSNIGIAQDYLPYAVFGKKVSTAGIALQEIFGASSTDPILLTSNMTTQWKRGYVESELIGPATKWGSLHWRQHAYNNIQSDSVRLSVLGIRLSGEVDTVISSLPRDSMDIMNLSSRINADTFPYLKLIAYMQDDSVHTPSQLNRWQVIYDGVPETALDPSLHFSFYSNELQEGDSIRFSTATHNISEYNMDSLLIKYWVIDKDRNAHLWYYGKQRPHPAGDTLITSITHSTKGYPGLNSLWVEVNPDNNQLEQYHFNNIGQVTFLVNTDKINPLLDVTFDAVHILNGDVVSGKPLIQIKLKDENKFLLLDEPGDTAFFKISLTTPSNPNPTRIYFGDQSFMKFLPTQSSVNACRIEYNPVFAEDGTYELYVFAKDKSGNHSGDIDYKISFEVINKSTITEVMNWPNPFSTATHFVFKLTGSEVPTYFKIQIMTITGKIVREINLDELGSIHVGRNITDYAWDGKDEFGDRLANGVYLYRVITNINGSSIEKAATSADKYFTKEFGKMYLIR